MINGAVLHPLQRKLRENGEPNTGWVIARSQKSKALCLVPVQTRPPLRCALLNVTATPRTTPCLRSADNERINMYIPSQVNARRRSNFTVQSRVEAPCAETSKKQFPH